MYTYPDAMQQALSWLWLISSSALIRILNRFKCYEKKKEKSELRIGVGTGVIICIIPINCYLDTDVNKRYHNKSSWNITSYS
jgi:hypothetical protein